MNEGQNTRNHIRIPSGYSRLLFEYKLLAMTREKCFCIMYNSRYRILRRIMFWTMKHLTASVPR